MCLALFQKVKAFLDYKKQRVKKVEKSGFFQRGQSMVLAKKFEIFSTLLFLARSTSKMCLTLFQKVKKRFQTIKNRKLKKSKNQDFSKGVHGFGKKFEIFFIFLLQAKQARKTFLSIFQKGERRFFDSKITKLKKSKFWYFSKEAGVGPLPGGGDSHMKQTGMLVVSLRGVNFGFWSRLGCSGQSANILSRQGLVQGSVKNLRFMIML